MSIKADNSYRTAKITKAAHEANERHYAAALASFDKYGKGPAGLTPDHIKNMPAWQKARADHAAAFAKMRAYNGHFFKHYKKEAAQERREKWEKTKIV